MADGSLGSDPLAARNDLGLSRLAFMKFTSFARLFGEKSRPHASPRRLRGSGSRGARLRVEPLESRELLSNDAPFIAAVMPPNGSTASSGQPALTVKFSEDMVASQAQNPANYLLFGTGGRSISID